jgi:hypothetical protein
MEFPSCGPHLAKIPFDGRLITPSITGLAGVAAHLPAECKGHYAA